VIAAARGQGKGSVVTSLLDGKATAAVVKAQVAAQALSLLQAGQPAGLAVIQVGTDPASTVYVRNKRRVCEELQLRSFAFDLPADIEESALLHKIEELNADPSVHGILVQLPLPRHIRTELVVDTIAPHKDVDGFHPVNAGKLALGRASGFVPCTPAGVVRILDHHGVSISGRRAVIVGRSNIVGKPMATLLLQRDATVTVAHSKTRDLPELLRSADLVVAAAGSPELIRGAWLQPDAVVVDVGIHRTADRGLVGDVAFSEAAPVASWITPVPGGVGPMTIAMLVNNTVLAATRALSATQRASTPGEA
jgi:methylenetetrahydrofolate dehydrogenase (NADP+)/methenyltetrahydrofolate cyclohydrolase